MLTDLDPFPKLPRQRGTLLQAQAALPKTWASESTLCVVLRCHDRNTQSSAPACAAQHISYAVPAQEAYSRTFAASSHRRVALRAASRSMT